MGDEQHYGYGIDYGWDEIMEEGEGGEQGRGRGCASARRSRKAFRIISVL